MHEKSLLARRTGAAGSSWTNRVSSEPAEREQARRQPRQPAQNW